jgi:hypothetical protein
MTAANTAQVAIATAMLRMLFSGGGRSSVRGRVRTGGFMVISSCNYIPAMAFQPSAIMAAAAAAKIASIAVMIQRGLTGWASALSTGFVGVVGYMPGSSWFRGAFVLTENMDPIHAFDKR